MPRAVRSVDIGPLQDTFLISAVTMIIVIRLQLWLTNYPQIGGGRLHIAHLLWGGLFMLVTILLLLSFLGRRWRKPAAVLGGIGFGFFIDELGKFITADNDYFYRPAAGIIYLIFIGLYLGSRAYQRHRGLTEDERVRNAIELIGEANHGPFKAEYRDQALALLAAVPATHPLRDPLVALAGNIDTTPNPDPPRYRRFADALAARYEHWSERGWFHRLVIGVFAFWALASFVTIAGLVLSFGFAGDAARAGFQEDSFSHLNFLNWATLVSTAVSTAFVVLGLERLLRGERLEAYLWLTRALLVSIFVTRVFTFVESQFGAVFGLAVDVLLLVSVRLMARQERRRSEPAAVS